MRRENVCKFITTASAEKLCVKNFIFEADRDIMKLNTSVEFNRAFLVVTGNVDFTVADMQINCTVGDLLFCFPHENISAEATEGAEYMYVSFCGGRAEELFSRFGINDKRRVFRDNEALIPVWRDSLFRADENAVDIAAESSLLFAFSRLAAENSTLDSGLKQAISIMENNFSDPELNLSYVASAVGYNPKYFSHLFKKKMNVPFSEYLKNLRIKHATFLFDHGIVSVKNVAYLSGFRDPLYFSEIFKSVLGVTPKQYKSSKEEQNN